MGESYLLTIFFSSCELNACNVVMSLLTDLKLDGLGKFADLSRAFLTIVSDFLTLGVGKNIPHGVMNILNMSG